MRQNSTLLELRPGLDYGIGIAGKCLGVYDITGVYKMAAKYFEHTLAIQ